MNRVEEADLEMIGRDPRILVDLHELDLPAHPPFLQLFLNQGAGEAWRVDFIEPDRLQEKRNAADVILVSVRND